MTFFPATVPVKWFVFDDEAKDEMNNDIPAWHPAEDRTVISWRPALTLDQSGVFEARTVTEAEMLVPPTFSYAVRDRMQFPDNVDDMYEVVGYRTGGQSWLKWNPGDVLSMRLVVD